VNTFACPVCGYPGLDEPPWAEDSPSYDICPCCGVEFGYDDFAAGDADLRPARHRELRRRWIDAGRPWWSQSRPPPPGWDPARQLAVFDDPV
jgi:hypothetical protein